MGCLKLIYQPEYSPLYISKGVNRTENVAKGFISTDPLKDKYPYYSSYQYAGNKPIIAIDIDGLESSANIGQQRKGLAQQRQGELQRREAAKVSGKKSPIEVTTEIAKVLFVDTPAAIFNEASTFVSGAAYGFQSVGRIVKGNFTGDFGEPVKRPDVLTTQGFKEFAGGEHSQIVKESLELTGNQIIEASKFAAAGAAGELVGASSKLAPYVERFLVDAATQSLAKTIDRFQETGRVEFRADDIDLANSFFKAALGKLSKDNSSLVLVEEGLKTIFDFNTSEGLTRKDLIEDQNEILAEFGLRLAFKFVKGGDKGNKAQQEFTLEVFKKTARTEAKETLFKGQEKKSDENR